MQGERSVSRSVSYCVMQSVQHSTMLLFTKNRIPNISYPAINICPRTLNSNRNAGQDLPSRSSGVKRRCILRLVCSALLSRFALFWWEMRSRIHTHSHISFCVYRMSLPKCPLPAHTCCLFRTANARCDHLISYAFQKANQKNLPYHFRSFTGLNMYHTRYDRIAILPNRSSLGNHTKFLRLHSW